jgi:hypothetical protein
MAVVFVFGTPVKTKSVVYKEETVKHGETETELGYQTEELIVNFYVQRSQRIFYINNKFQ